MKKLFLMLLFLTVVTVSRAKSPLLCNASTVVGYRDAYIAGVNFFNAFQGARRRSAVNVNLTTEDWQTFVSQSNDYCNKRYKSPAFYDPDNDCRAMQCILGAQGAIHQ
jgi:hypothetical protein